MDKLAASLEKNTSLLHTVNLPDSTPIQSNKERHSSDRLPGPIVKLVEIFTNNQETIETERLLSSISEIKWMFPQGIKVGNPNLPQVPNDLAHALVSAAKNIQNIPEIIRNSLITALRGPQRHPHFS